MFITITSNNKRGEIEYNNTKDHELNTSIMNEKLENISLRIESIDTT